MPTLPLLPRTARSAGRAVAHLVSPIALLALVALGCSESPAAPRAARAPGGPGFLLAPGQYSGEYAWTQGQITLDLGSAAGQVCFLTRVGGNFAGAGEAVQVLK